MFSIRITPVLLSGLLLVLAGCNSIAPQPVVRAKHERYLSKMTLRGNIRGRNEQAHTFNGVEVAIKSWSKGLEFEDEKNDSTQRPKLREGAKLPELFFDIGSFQIDDRDYQSLDADGYGMGLGIKSPPPVEPGPGIDYLLRLGYFNADFDADARHLYAPNWDYNGPTSDMLLGGHYSLNVGEGVLFSPEAGIYFKSLNDQWNWFDDLYSNDDDRDPSDPSDTGDDNFHLYSTGAYLGFKINPATLEHFDFSARYYMGTGSTQGLLLSAGIRF